MDPFLGGGEMISEVTLEHATWNEVPWKYEAGTPNIADVIAFGAALEYLEQVGMPAVREHEQALTRYTLDKLSSIEGLRLFGPADAQRRGGAISFNLAGIHPHDLGTYLDTEGIAVRVGHHCAQPLMRAFQVPAMVRASSYLYTTEQEIDVLAGALKQAQHFFGVG
jgi:cysteine desulfurase/selenocysteine lyase